MHRHDTDTLTACFGGSALSQKQFHLSQLPINMVTRKKKSSLKIKGQVFLALLDTEGVM